MYNVMPQFMFSHSSKDEPEKSIPLEEHLREKLTPEQYAILKSMTVPGREGAQTLEEFEQGLKDLQGSATLFTDMDVDTYMKYIRGE